MKNLRRSIVIGLVLLPHLATAATLHLKSGVTIEGTNLQRDGAVVTIETPSNTLRFPASDVDLKTTFSGTKRKSAATTEPKDPAARQKARRSPAPAAQKPKQVKTAPSQAPADPPKPKLFTYRSPGDGFEVTYPITWRKIPRDDNTFVITSYLDQSALSISRSQTTLTAEQLKTYLKGTGREDFLKQIRSSATEASMIAVEETLLGGNDASLLKYRFRYSDNGLEHDVSGAQILCIQNGSLYRVQFETTTSQFAANFPTFEKIIATFAFR